MGTVINLHYVKLSPNPFIEMIYYWNNESPTHVISQNAENDNYGWIEPHQVKHWIIIWYDWLAQYASSITAEM